MRVVTVAGEPRVGRDLPGRGAWLCAGSTGCFDRAARRGAFARALRTAVDAGSLARLRGELFGAP